jgi:hypothetical protein
VTCARIVKHAVHCLGCGKTWVEEDEECICTCTDPEMETWTVTELCADCGQPMDGHPGYLSLAADPRDWTADQLMTLIAEALEARDLEAVPYLITLLAFKDPHLAETVHGSMLAVLPPGGCRSDAHG